jgi:preprotein translocase subunit SecG
MNWVFSLLLTVHILVALSIIGLVLMQHGKGADMGAAFGSGASGSLFGATGSANFLSRTTGVLAAVFFLTSLSLAYVASQKPKTTGSVMQETVQSSRFRNLRPWVVSRPRRLWKPVQRQRKFRSNVGRIPWHGPSPGWPKSSADVVELVDTLS